VFFFLKLDFYTKITAFLNCPKKISRYANLLLGKWGEKSKIFFLKNEIKREREREKK
jgi:hypothetical protein